MQCCMNSLVLAKHDHTLHTLSLHASRYPCSPMLSVLFGLDTVSAGAVVQGLQMSTDTGVDGAAVSRHLLLLAKLHRGWLLLVMK